MVGGGSEGSKTIVIKNLEAKSMTVCAFSIREEASWNNDDGPRVSLSQTTKQNPKENQNASNPRKMTGKFSAYFEGFGERERARAAERRMNAQCGV